MGISASSLINPFSVLRGQKRRRSDDSSDSDTESFLEETLNTPKRKKLLTTAKYIYQALYKEEKNSDVTVIALGKPWHLHKIYLCQSPYFKSMFGGSWRESFQDIVHIKIADPRITLDSLSTVFGSLYLDEIVIEPKEVISILATATLFQLEGIIEQCTLVMRDTINTKTAVNYYEAACEYGVTNVKEAAFKWLLVNLMGYFYDHVKWLKEVSVELMTQLISSPDLFVIQTEFTIYILLRYWMYLKLHSENDDEYTDNDFEPKKFFQERQDKTPFLLTKQGKPFAKAFQALRLQHILMHHLDIEMLQKDNIIPNEWINPTVLHQWHSMLRIDQSLDKGPKEISDELFYKHSLRCGRLLPIEGNHMWRWTGFNFGLDLILILEERSFRIKRNHRFENGSLLSLQPKRYILLRVTVACLNEQRQIHHIQTTPIRGFNLSRNEEVSLFKLERELVFPLLVSVNLLVKTPNSELNSNLNLNDSNNESTIQLDSNIIINNNDDKPINSIKSTLENNYKG
ncbi:protein germ cell-less [Chrysoperla carnea]|uniref:protein germ cell-less n=1 Tax=Chrysoperla carnea TaxID=189513 RepID=UPI001D08C385|nr:protein germ cell-less [Chrysoperla carnea]